MNKEHEDDFAWKALLWLGIALPFPAIYLILKFTYIYFNGTVFNNPSIYILIPILLLISFIFVKQSEKLKGKKTINYTRPLFFTYGVLWFVSGFILNYLTHIIKVTEFGPKAPFGIMACFAAGIALIITAIVPWKSSNKKIKAD